MVIPALSSQTVSGMKSLSFIDITIDCGKCLQGKIQKLDNIIYNNWCKLYNSWKGGLKWYINWLLSTKLSGKVEGRLSLTIKILIRKGDYYYG